MPTTQRDCARCTTLRVFTADKAGDYRGKCWPPPKQPRDGNSLLKGCCSAIQHAFNGAKGAVLVYDVKEDYLSPVRLRRVTRFSLLLFWLRISRRTQTCSLFIQMFALQRP